jgi:hypothetical protein
LLLLLRGAPRHWRDRERDAGHRADRNIGQSASPARAMAARPARAPWFRRLRQRGWLKAKTGNSWAVLASLITALLNDVDPQPWLTDVLERIVSGQTKSHQLAKLLPWNWKTARDPGQALQMAA